MRRDSRFNLALGLVLGAALRARSLLDGAVIATSLLDTSWALVLGPVFRAGQGGVLEQAIALAYPVGDVALATVVFVVVARSRVGGAPCSCSGPACSAWPWPPR
jgi:hypothetical protein